MVYLNRRRIPRGTQHEWWVNVMLMAFLPAIAITQSLPTSRSLSHPPAVPQVGSVPTEDEGTATMPVRANLSNVDLEMYDAQLATMYPFSGEAYPADSIAATKQSRATAWMKRLQSLEGVSTTGIQLVALARTAAMAKDDALAKTTFDTRLAAANLTAGEQAFALNAAIHAFADVSQKEDQLAKNMLIAEAYMTKLDAIPRRAHLMRRDSVGVLYRQYDGHIVLVNAYYRIGHSQPIIYHGDRALTLLALIKGGVERYEGFKQYPFNSVALAMAGQQNGRAKIDALGDRAIGLMRLTAADVEDPQDRQRVETGLIARVKQVIRAYALLGTSAPPILAHAFLNTPDSIYAPTPHSQSLNDGAIHVLDFGTIWCWPCQAAIPALSRLQRRFGQRGVNVMFVTNTEGYIGQTLVGRAEEMTWLKAYYVGKRKLTVPIAIWAGEKQPAEFDGKKPEKSPVYEAYAVTAFPTMCIIDGNGIVRAYAHLQTHEQEEDMAKLLNYLIVEAKHAAPGGNPSSPPPGIVTPNYVRTMASR